MSDYDVCVVGGAGHVGAPLAIVLAAKGMRTLIYDIDVESMKILAGGEMPFLEEGGLQLLRQVLAKRMLAFSPRVEDIKDILAIILTIGTPVDEFHNPDFSLLTSCLDQMLPFLSARQTIILRSTVAPGATEFVERYLNSRGKKMKIAFCPERVVQGKAIEEIQILPQLVSGTSPEALQVASDLFSKIAPEIVPMSPKEAEFAKLICNAFRYIEFAATNQLYMMVETAGIDYNGLLNKLKWNYPRMNSIPGPGFTAGPCLMKDTMQLFAFQRHNFILGQVAMTINEGLPNFIVERLAKKFDLEKMKVGILGMAFKADSDDIRDSLSYKLKKIFESMGTTVCCSDEYVKDAAFISKEELIRSCDVIVIGVPHRQYKDIDFAGKTVVDLWDIKKSPALKSASEDK